MVQTKTELFDPNLAMKARLFKALAHPARLQILQFLAETKSCITNDISDDLPLGRTTVNQHLKELKEAGLIVGHSDGTKTKYCLCQSEISKLHDSLFSFLNCIRINNYTCK